MGKWWNGSVIGPWYVTGHPATYRCLRQVLNPDLSSRVPSRSRSSKETLCANCQEWVRPQRSLSIFHNSHWSPAAFFICTHRNLLVRLPWSCASHRRALWLAVKKYGKFLWSKRKKDWKRIGSAVCPQLWFQLASPVPEMLFISMSSNTVNESKLHSISFHEEIINYFWDHQLPLIWFYLSFISPIINRNS